MKDEVEKLIGKFGIDASCWGLNPDKYPKPKDPTPALLALFQKAQVEAVRAGRIEEIEALYARSDKDLVLRDKLDQLYVVRYPNIGGGNIFLLDRLANLKEDGETK